MNDIFSVSLAGRYISARKKASAAFQLTPTALGVLVGMPSRAVVLDYEEDAGGLWMIMGLNIAKAPFNIGMRYEMRTDLDFDYTVNQDTVTGLPAGIGAARGIANGVAHSRDLPAVLGFGLCYSLSPKLRFDTNLTVYLQPSADWDGAEDNVDNGWDVGMAIEYIFWENFKGSIGYLHTNTGIKARYMLNEAPELNADSLGAGVVYSWKTDLEITVAIGMASYDSDSYIDSSSGTPMVIGFEKDVTFLSCGLQYSF